MPSPATTYPTAIDDGVSLPDPAANTDTIIGDHAGLHDAVNNAVRALETKLGAGASTPSAGTVLRGTGAGTTAYGKVDLTADVSGVLPIANGGTGGGSAAAARTALGLGTIATLSTVSLTTNVTGTLPVANGGTGAVTLTGLLVGNGTSPFTTATAGVDYAGISTAQVLTATAVQERVLTTTGGTATPTAASYDGVTGTLSSALSIASPGTGFEGQKQWHRYKDNGTARGLAWNAIFRPLGVSTPLATIPNKTVYVGTKYNATDAKWDIVAVAQET